MIDDARTVPEGACLECDIVVVGIVGPHSSFACVFAARAIVVTDVSPLEPSATRRSSLWPVARPN